MDDSTFTFDGKVVYVKDMSLSKEGNEYESYVRTNEESEESDHELQPNISKMFKDVDDGGL